MEVTRSNFNEVLPQVENGIKNATFLTIDCELTGLNIVTDINSYDSQTTYYEKVRRNCKNFLVIQYGLSCFRYDQTNNVFKQQSYSFYIFRRPVNRHIPDQRFLCQTSSIDFLISQDFDFNKLFKEGISYLNLPEQTKYKEGLEEIQKNRANTLLNRTNGESKISISENDQPIIDKLMKQIEDFIKSSETEIHLPKSNAFIRRLVYQTAGEKFGDEVSLETKKVGNDRVLAVGRRKTKQEKKEQEEQRVQEELREMDDAVGFSKVLKMIVDSGKLVVGHNLCLDILHTIEKFMTPLPTEYEEFKICAHSLFGNILDTKFMSSREPFKDLILSSVLGHLIETVSEKPFKIPAIEIEENCKGYTLDDKKEHEAGYDAFITGVGFLAMWKQLGTKRSHPDLETFRNFKLLQPYLNRIYLMKLQDNPYIHLGGKDPVISRDHVFYMTFPKDWKTNDLIQLFSPFGNVHIAWIDESSAYVGLYRKDQAAVALSTLSQSDTYTIKPFAKRQAELAGMPSTFSSPHARKKRTPESAPREVKKRRTNSFGEGNYSKRSFEPIAEEEDEEKTDETDTGGGKEISDNLPLPSCNTSPNSSRKRKADKMFDEDSSWE